MAKKKFLFDYTHYAVQKLISAVIVTGAKKNIVCTFSSIKPFRGAVIGDFSITGTAKTKDALTLDTSANTVTVSVTADYAHAETCNLVYNPSKAKGDTITIPVTNTI
jgi:hypothetical protein